MAELNTDVRFVRGVGEARAKSLAKLGITDLKSLISYFPRAYEDRRESRHGPLPFVIYPIISSPGTGLQHFDNFTKQLSISLYNNSGF